MGNEFDEGTKPNEGNQNSLKNETALTRSEWNINRIELGSELIRGSSGLRKIIHEIHYG